MLSLESLSKSRFSCSHQQSHNVGPVHPDNVNFPSIRVDDQQPNKSNYTNVLPSGAAALWGVVRVSVR